MTWHIPGPTYHVFSGVLHLVFYKHIRANLPICGQINATYSSLQAVVGSSNSTAVCSCSILHRHLPQSWPNWQTNSHCCLSFWVRWWVSWFFDPRSVVPEMENSSVCLFVVGWGAVVNMDGWNFAVKWRSNDILTVQKKHLAHLHAQAGHTGQHKKPMPMSIFCWHASGHLWTGCFLHTNPITMSEGKQQFERSRTRGQFPLVFSF